MRATLESRVPAMSIGAVSRRLGVSVDAIRYYERLGLLPGIARTAGGHRLYGEAHLRRLLFIRRGRVLGLSLKEMRAMLNRDANSCADVRALLRERAVEVERRLAELRALKRELDRLLKACGEAELTDCRILEAMLANDDDLAPAMIACA